MKIPIKIKINPDHHNLTNHGYSHPENMSLNARHRTLKKTLSSLQEKYGPRKGFLRLIRQLNAIAVLLKKDKKESRIIKEDQKWISQLYKSYKQKAGIGLGDTYTRDFTVGKFTIQITKSSKMHLKSNAELANYDILIINNENSETIDRKDIKISQLYGVFNPLVEDDMEKFKDYTEGSMLSKLKYEVNKLSLGNNKFQKKLNDEKRKPYFYQTSNYRFGGVETNITKLIKELRYDQKREGKDKWKYLIRYLESLAVGEGLNEAKIILLYQKILNNNENIIKFWKKYIDDLKKPIKSRSFTNQSTSSIYQSYEMGVHLGNFIVNIDIINKNSRRYLIISWGVLDKKQIIIERKDGFTQIIFGNYMCQINDNENVSINDCIQNLIGELSSILNADKKTLRRIIFFIQNSKDKVNQFINTDVLVKILKLAIEKSINNENYNKNYFKNMGQNPEINS